MENVDRSIELRLLKQAERIAEMYEFDVTKEKHEELCHAINVCRKYVEDGEGDWCDLYDIAYGEDGIWLNQCDETLREIELDMWGVEGCIISCICYLGCMRENGGYFPQDLESIIEENIPKFVEFVESDFKNKEDAEKYFDFFNKEVCY